MNWLKPTFGDSVAVIRTTLTFLLLVLISLSCPSAFVTAEDKHADEDGHKEEHKEEVSLSLGALRKQGVMTGKVLRRGLAETLRAPAEIGFNESRRVVITARSGGWTEKVTVFANQRVGKNRLLAEIYSPEFLSAQQAYLLTYARAQRAAPEDITRDNKALLADAEQRLRILGLTKKEIRQLATKQEPFPYLHVHSPITGTVVEHKLNTGDTVQPGQALYVIADLRTVWANIALTESKLAKVSPEQPVTLTVKAYPDLRFEGSILSLGAGMDEATRTVKARALVKNTGNRLKPGMFADAEIGVAEGDSVLVVPAEAVIRFEGRETVFKVEGDALHPQPVETGATRGGFTEIRAGLAEGEQIAVKGAFVLKSLALKSQIGDHD